MAEVVGNYDQDQFAADALDVLREKLGLALAVFRDLENLVEPQSEGSKIQLRRPQKFTAAVAPSTPVELDTDSITMTLDQHFDVAFAVTDKTASLTVEKFKTDHTVPMANALALQVDTSLQGLVTNVPHSFDQTAAGVVISDLTGVNDVLFANNVPVTDDQANIFLMVDGTTRGQLNALPDFNRVDGAGQVGLATQISGNMGMKFGMNIFPTQNVKAHTSGTVISGADQVGAVNNGAGYPTRTTSIVVDAFTGSETLKDGDSFVFTGHTQRYSVNADVTLSTGAGTITFEPGLVAAVIDDEVITFEASSSTIHADSFSRQLAFHRNWAALTMVPLTTQGQGAGADFGLAVDDRTGLVLRTTRYYDGATQKLVQRMDALWGVVTLDHNLAAQLRRNI